MTSWARRSPCYAVDALNLQRESDIAEDGQVRQQGEVLKHHAHAMPADVDHLLIGQGQQVASLEEDLAAGGVDQS